jgi:hypothetical protein
MGIPEYPEKFSRFECAGLLVYVANELLEDDPADIEFLLPYVGEFVIQFSPMP